MRDQTPVAVAGRPRIPTGLTGTIQSDDTAYVGHVSLSLALPLVFAVLLTVLAVPWNLAFAITGVAALAKRRRARRGPPTGAAPWQDPRLSRAVRGEPRRQAELLTPNDLRLSDPNPGDSPPRRD